jgi:hypothetical protein
VIAARAPLPGAARGGGRRTRVWIDGIPEPIVASRTERAILTEMGASDSAAHKLVDEAVALAEKIVEDADSGRVDLGDLARRARRLLESTARTGETDQLF